LYGIGGMEKEWGYGRPPDVIWAAPLDRVESGHAASSPPHAVRYTLNPTPKTLVDVPPLKPHSIRRRVGMLLPPRRTQSGAWCVGLWIRVGVRVKRVECGSKGFNPGASVFRACCFPPCERSLVIVPEKPGNMRGWVVWKSL